MHQQTFFLSLWSLFFVGKKTRRGGCPLALLLLGHSDIRLGEEESFFFCLFFKTRRRRGRGGRADFSVFVAERGHAARTQDAPEKTRDKKERKRKTHSPHFIIRILQNHNVYRAIRIYDCGKCAYSNAIIVRFDRIIVRVKVIGEREKLKRAIFAAKNCLIFPLNCTEKKSILISSGS